MAQPSSGGIKIESRKDLEAWLQDKPHAVAQAITTRAALRVLPLICGDSVETIRGGYPKSGLLFGAFRCLFLPSVTMLGDVTESIKKAAHSAAAASIQAPAFSNTPDAAAAAARSAANSLASNVSCASNATYNSYYAVTDPADRISILAAVEVDCRQFDAGKSVADVMRSPIWSKPTPDWVRAAWRATTGNKSLRIARFAPWFKWYEGIAGLYDGSTCDIFGPDLSLKIALQPDDWWKRGVEAVNADVIRWLAEKEGEVLEEEPQIAAEITEIGENIPQQRPAAYNLGWRGGKLVPQPAEAAPDAADALVMLEELRRKAKELIERLTETNCHPRIIRSVELLLDALPENLATVNSGLLRSRGRSIESDSTTFAASEELPDDVKSHLRDVAGSLLDTLVCFPKIREKEAAARAFDLVGADVDQVLRDLKVMRDGAAAADVVAAETVQALDAMAQTPEDPATFVRSDAGRLWLADRLLVAGNYLAELARGATTVVYDRLAQTGTKAGDAWRAVRPKLVHGVVIGLEGLNRPEIYAALIGALAGATANAAYLIGLLGYPLLKPMIERAIKHLKTLAEKSPDDG